MIALGRVSMLDQIINKQQVWMASCDTSGLYADVAAGHVPACTISMWSLVRRCQCALVILVSRIGVVGLFAAHADAHGLVTTLSDVAIIQGCSCSLSLARAFGRTQAEHRRGHATLD